MSVAPTRRTLAIAAKAQARLHTRYWHLVERRKTTHVAATAVAEPWRWMLLLVVLLACPILLLCRGRLGCLAAELAGPTAHYFILLTPDYDPWAGWEGPDRSGQLERPRRAARKADG